MFSELPELNIPIDVTGLNITDSQFAPSKENLTKEKDS